MASAASTPLSSSPLRQSIVATSASHCVSLPPTLAPPPLPQSGHFSKTFAYCRKFARNVVAMATTEEAPPTITAAAATTTEIETTTEMPDFVKTIQDTWDKVEDKYAVSSLAVAGAIGLVASSGMISAIDKLPLVPGVLELVGIGYTGWFAYRNLIFKPEREALIQKIKNTYGDIIGTS